MATSPTKQQGVTIHYPSFLEDTDFETHRKIVPHWKEVLDKSRLPIIKAGLLDGEEVESEEQKERTRCIVQLWPRDPNGEVMGEAPDGKMTPNGLPLWGATLYDFYFVNKVPGVTRCLSLISGSRMAKWAREHGETFALDYIEQAEDEEHEPQVMHPYHIGEFIELVEQQVHLGKTGRSLKVDKNVSEKVPECLLPPSEYSGRWPLVPFSTPTCRLQERIPLRKLPKRLTVHDPFNCLNGKAPIIGRSKAKWKARPDVVYTYNLQLDQIKGDNEIADNDSSAEETPEAHLYLTPKRRIGSGHHSFTYQVEWEVPRELVVKPKTCYTCACEDGPIRKQELDGGTRELFELKQQHPSYCQHLDDGVPRPKTAKVSVIAKLTMPKGHGEDHPAHLRNEARKYQSFPDHFFEHWNGYNIVKPCLDPLPIGAVVPQFYGYYVPDKSCLGSGFKSPILLLENCGVQANMKQLTLEERRECWFLLKRLHMEGYAHNSVYERNVLVQRGPVQWSPFNRNKSHPRFRLIDFGRTMKISESDRRSQADRETEDSEAGRDFRLGFGYLPF